MATFEVTVGNVGLIHAGDDDDTARAEFWNAAKRSLLGAGRDASETVVLWVDGEPEEEYTPARTRRIVALTGGDDG